MPKLIILAGHDKGTVYELFGEVTIGRGDDCDVVLDHNSVSRQHVRLTAEGSTVEVEDLDSSNGVIVGGEATRRSTLQMGAEIGVGRYTLVVVDDDEKFYKGRFISYFPEHGQSVSGSQMRTHQLEPGELERMEQKRRLINKSRLQLVDDPSAYWVPGAHKITFGGEGMVPVEGWFTGGIVSEVAWNGQVHVIRALARLVRVKVNGKSVREVTLAQDDEVLIGGTAMLYKIVD